MDLLLYTTLLMKLLHIGAVCLWVAGLILLSLLFRAYRPNMRQDAFNRFRKLTHYGYVRFLTPAAVIAVGAGIALILLRGNFEPWLMVKLSLVCGLVIAHAYIGHLIVLTAVTAGHTRLYSPLWVLGAVLLLSLAILAVVLAKPVIAIPFPDWMLEPRSMEFPTFEFSAAQFADQERRVPIW